MASFPGNALASFNGMFTIEKIFAVLNALLQARKLIAGNYDPLKTGIVAGTAYTLISSNQAAELFGFGSQLHRMMIYQEKGAGGQIPVTAFALPASGGAAATKTVTFATNASSAGTYIFRAGSYLIEDLVSINVANGDTPTIIAALLNTAINANENLPFTSGVALGVVTLTAKTVDITSESLLVTNNQKTEEVELLPDDMTVSIADAVSGTGESSLSELWDYVAAESTPWNTSIVHPYISTGSLDSASLAIGQPNDQSGQYDARDYRPASVFSTDRTPGNAGLVTALALADGRKLDAGNIRLETPDYPELGFEIAVYVSAKIEIASMVNSSRAYTPVLLPDLYGPLDPTEDWTTFKLGGKAYDNRDLAVKAGLTVITHVDGVSQLGDVSGFWKPESNQNAPFKFQVNRWKAWNIQNIYNIYVNGTENKGRAIVFNVAATDQAAGAIDSDLLTSGVALVSSLIGRKAWIFDADFTIRNTQVIPSSSNPDRFDFKIPVVVSGNYRIGVGEIAIDRDPSVITLTIVQS